LPAVWPDATTASNALHTTPASRSFAIERVG
jgi:hypothetical protein